MLAFSLGAGTGSSGAQAEVSELKTDGTALAQQVEETESRVAELQVQLDDANDQLGASRQREQELQAAIDQRVQEVASLTEQKVSLEARVSELEPAASAPAPAPVPLVTQPTGAYYANCTAARSAGAAPLYAGSPGYGPHLDRDGDGVACE